MAPMLSARAATLVAATTTLLFALACGGLDDFDDFDGPVQIGESCPAHAMSAATVADGTRLRLIALHPGDAYAESASISTSFRGRVQGDMRRTEDCWMAGGFVGDDGNEYYFYMAAFQQ